MDRGLLARATEGTDAPTPGYLYNDLIKSATAAPMSCPDMARYLCQRLTSKQNPNIKAKCAKVLAKLADGVPRNQFRRAVAQDAHCVAAIKEAMQHRGPPDPVRGDEPNARVRAAAKEALDAVYRESAEPAGVPSLSYGNGPHPNPSAAGSGMRTMQGVGNPMFADPRQDPRYNGTQPNNFKEAMREAGDVLVGMIKDPLARNITPGPHNNNNASYGGQHHSNNGTYNVPRQGHSGDLPGYNRSQNYGRPPPGASELSRQTGGQWTMASNRGPGAINTEVAAPPSYPPTGSAAGTVGGSWGQVSAAAPPSSHHHASSLSIRHVNPTSAAAAPPAPLASTAAVSDGSYEKNLVMELCPPGGLKPVPPADKLQAFARNLPSLNADLICPVVLDCLEEGQPWIIRAKALGVVDTCIRHGVANLATGENPYRNFFHACADEIAPLANHPRAAIKEPARRVLAQLGLQTPAAVGAPPVAAPPVAAPPAAAVNLLDFDDAAPAPPAAPPPAPPVDMFGGMQIKSAAPPPAAPAPPEPDLLGDLMGGSTTTTTTTTAPAAAAPPPAPPVSMFDQMNLKTTTETPAPPKVEAPAGASGFSFINNSTPENSNTNTTTMTLDAPKDTPTVATATPVFDPLQQVAPPPATAPRKMMTMSHEQMQAMAYQQNMWLQQQQQMQMMVLMQQQQQMGLRLPPGMLAAVPPTQAPAQQAQRPAQKDDKKFDFVKSAMKTAKK